MNELMDLWEAALQRIRPGMAKVTYDTWFAGLEPMELKGNELLLVTHMNLAKNVIETNYKTEIQAALLEVCGFPVNPVILTEEEAGTYQLAKPQVEVPANETDFGLIPKYSFDTFVVGSSNRFAHAASLAVAETPGLAYNPLFLYGPSGLGKTHLMHAIGNYILGKNPMSKVMYVSSEVFTNELINSIKDNTNQKFRDKYRQLDVLLVDDIQFIAGKDTTEEEFFHTFNHLQQANKQIIISCDRPPSEMHSLEERLRSRFEGGLTCDLQPPDYETRVAILKKKCQEEQIEIKDDVLEFIADSIVSNIRELEGGLTRISAYAKLNRVPITKDTAMAILKDYATKTAKTYTFQQIQRKVAEYYDVSVEDILSPKRSKEIAMARHVAVYICRTLLPHSLPQIGDNFGGRDHSTIINSLSKIEKELSSNSHTKQAVESIIKSIKEE